MSKLSTDISSMKQKYREIFLKSSDEIHNQIERICPQRACENCPISPCAHSTSQNKDIFAFYPEGCAYKNWQNSVLKMFEDEISPNIYKKWVYIQKYAHNFSCIGCATCCKLACSEFSYEELKLKAQAGDVFAGQFLSVFVPYEDVKQAQKIYPEYFELLSEKLEGENVYFYHCPKLTDDNRCSDYENRPAICRDFPDNPLSILPFKCGYSCWKEEVEPTALMLHSMLEIVSFYTNKLKQVAS